MSDKMVIIAPGLKVLGSCIVAVLLLSIVSFPLGHDQALFETGGAMIAKNSAVPFRDFLDMKQPLIFYIYSFSTLFFGRHEWSSRLLDVVYHVVTLLLFYKLIREVSKNEKIALTSVFCYTLYIVGSGFWMTTNTETFAFLPQLCIVYALLKLQNNPSTKNTFLMALICCVSTALLILLKITFGFVICTIFFWLVLTSANSKRVYFRFSIHYVACLIATITLTLFWLSYLQALDNIILSLEWVSKYASSMPLFGIETFRTYYYKVFPEELLVTITPSYLILMLFSFFVLLPTDARKRNTYWQFKIFCILVIVFGLVGVAVERKSFNYHYTRFAWAIVPFVSEAIIHIYDGVKQWLEGINPPRAFQKMTVHISIIIAIFVILLIFSPIPRVIDQGFGWGIISIQNNDSARTQKLRSNKYDVTEIKQIADKLKNGMKKSDQIFLWGNMSQLYLECDRLPTTICIVNPQFISPWTPIQWTNTIADQLTKSIPLYFISEHHDSRPLISGTTEDSFQSLTRIPILYNFLVQNYVLMDSTEHFKIFKRMNL